MNNVTLDSRGMHALVLFLHLQELYPDSKITEPKLRWWQNRTRYRLELPNISKHDTLVLVSGINLNWPLSHAIKIKVDSQV